MSVSYDLFTDAFLRKITSYDFPLEHYERTKEVDSYMKYAISKFRRYCRYDLSTTQDDNIREFIVDIPDYDLHEIVDIVSDGMVAQWLMPYANKSELMELQLNTRDFTGYSPANILKEIRAAYDEVRQRFNYEIRQYTYDRYAESEDEE